MAAHAYGARAALRHRGHLRDLHLDRPDRDAVPGRLGRGPVAGAHLAHCAGSWLSDLLSDASPFSWWYDDTVDEGFADLRTWLAGPGASRLRAHGEPDLAIRAELLALPYEERWDHPYWDSPSATN